MNRQTRPAITDLARITRSPSMIELRECGRPMNPFRGATSTGSTNTFRYRYHGCQCRCVNDPVLWSIRFPCAARQRVRSYRESPSAALRIKCVTRPLESR